MEKNEMSCILVAAGEQTLETIERKEKSFVIAVDGGIDFCEKNQLEPNLYIGDFDSVKAKYIEKIENIKKISENKIISLPCEKDDTDLMAACRKGIELGFRDFYIYCGTGGRLSHTLGNIQCLLFLKRKGATATMIDKRQKIFVLENETFEFTKEKKGMISIFSLGDEVESLSIKGLKYSTDNLKLYNDYPIGISNEFIEKDGRIVVKNGAIVVIMEEED